MVLMAVEGGSLVTSLQKRRSRCVEVFFWVRTFLMTGVLSFGEPSAL